eukprot:COSAG04_NODE_3840_length_2483_cov_2.932466_1_plen_130_part_10
MRSSCEQPGAAFSPAPAQQREPAASNLLVFPTLLTGASFELLLHSAPAMVRGPGPAAPAAAARPYHFSSDTPLRAPADSCPRALLAGRCNGITSLTARGTASWRGGARWSLLGVPRERERCGRRMKRAAA